MLQYGIRQTAEVASNMVSVERVLQYTKLDKETVDGAKTIENVENWPRHGKITFKNMYLRYTPDDAPILKNLNVEIKAQEKVIIRILFKIKYLEGIRFLTFQFHIRHWSSEAPSY